ncbi:hypothetical protein F4Y93_00945 [Candidatus Poribacteria bacterium]|nr:hypothetical protein [Candidatus Poribacteria bacterium]
MANQQRNLTSESIFQRFFTSVLALLGQLRELETWQTLLYWVLWRVIPKRRRILRLIQELQPLHQNASPEMRTLRDEVFTKSCLELKRPEHAETLLEVLNGAHHPLGFEQIFLAAIYPVLVKRDMAVIPMATGTEHRLDVEVGYLGHNEDYFFWVFEIDGTKRLTLGTPLNPREAVRDDKRYVVYSLGSNRLVDTDFAEYAERWLLDSPRLTIALPLLAAAYADQWILNARLYLNHILTDLKKRNYYVTAMTVPDFERERLSLLRRLSLDRLRKRRLQSERRKR